MQWLQKALKSISLLKYDFCEKYLCQTFHVSRLMLSRVYPFRSGHHKCVTDYFDYTSRCSNSIEQAWDCSLLVEVFFVMCLLQVSVQRRKCRLFTFGQNKCELCSSKAPSARNRSKHWSSFSGGLFHLTSTALLPS